LSKSTAGTLNLVKEIRAEVIVAKKEATGADFIITQLVRALSLALNHILDNNADKEAIVTLRNRSVAAHHWLRRQSRNQADRDPVFGISVNITNDIHGFSPSSSSTSFSSIRTLSFNLYDRLFLFSDNIKIIITSTSSSTISVALIDQHRYDRLDKSLLHLLQHQ
jgi:hypothetical protein